MAGSLDRLRPRVTPKDLQRRNLLKAGGVVSLLAAAGVLSVQAESSPSPKPPYSPGPEFRPILPPSSNLPILVKQPEIPIVEQRRLPTIGENLRFEVVGNFRININTEDIIDQLAVLRLGDTPITVYLTDSPIFLRGKRKAGYIVVSDGPAKKGKYDAYKYDVHIDISTYGDPDFEAGSRSVSEFASMIYVHELRHIWYDVYRPRLKLSQKGIWPRPQEVSELVDKSGRGLAVDEFDAFRYTNLWLKNWRNGVFELPIIVNPIP